MLSFEEIEIGSMWRCTATGHIYVVNGKEPRIIGHDGWVKYHSHEDSEHVFESEWKTFVTNHEEVQ